MLKLLRLCTWKYEMKIKKIINKLLLYQLLISLKIIKIIEVVEIIKIIKNMNWKKNYNYNIK